MAKSVRRPFTFAALLRLTRFWNLVIIGLAQYLTAGFLIDASTIWDYKLFLVSLSTILIAAAGYIINDYYDVKIDLINKPERVVIGKSMSRRLALLFHTVISFTGTGIGLLVSWKIGAINFFSAFFLWLYSNNLKRLAFVGNLMVAMLTGLSVFMINVLYHVHNSLVTTYALFAFFITLVREIVKDMEDLRGDNTFGCRTLPIVWGIRKTKMLLYGLVVLFATVVLVMNEVYIHLPIYYFVIFLFVPLAWLIFRLVRADTRKDFYNLSQLCKVIMLLGIASMIFI